MAAKDVKFGVDARDRMLRGVGAIFTTVDRIAWGVGREKTAVPVIRPGDPSLRPS